MEKILEALAARPEVSDAEAMLDDERAHRTILHWQIEAAVLHYIPTLYAVNKIVIDAIGEVTVYGWADDDSPVEVKAHFAQPNA